MSAAADTRHGGCLCGAVRYELPAAPEGFDACHCGMCRKWAGGPALAFVAPEGVTWTGTEHIRTFASSDWAERAFCDRCGSGLFWRMTAEGPAQGMTTINAGTLDSLDGLALTHEIFIDHKPAGYAFAGDRRRMTEAEVLAMFAPGDGEG